MSGVLSYWRAQWFSATVGPLIEDHVRNLTQRVDWAPHSRDSQSHRTLDEALHELLAEWEQF
jgi:hypothetical protein